ncbi:MAG: hypothetical protein J6Q60_05495 [Bacteroidaceae bacterium]|nr:hypothetical protein [Bacteroidaceae bacterium]
MGTVFLYGNGGGGAGLNFKVVGNPKPADPKENTIWANTDAKITSYIFTALEPDHAEEGALWISISTTGSSAFNVLKKNGIVICPQSAKQFIGGVWESLDAEIYQGGRWIEWVTYLLSAGGFATELGDMTSYGENGVNIQVSSLVGGGIYVQRTSNNGGYVALCSEYAIDISEFNTMRIKTGAVESSQISVGFSSVNNSAAAATSGNVVSSALTANSEVFVDLSDKSGKYYLAITMSHAGMTMTAELLEIALDKS